MKIIASAQEGIWTAAVTRRKRNPRFVSPKEVPSSGRPGKAQKSDLNRRKSVQPELMPAVVEQLLKLPYEDRDQVELGLNDRGPRHKKVRETVHDPGVVAGTDFEDSEAELEHGPLD